MMIRLFFYSLILSALVGCSEHPSEYYLEHPLALNAALRDCYQSSKTSHVFCARLHEIARELNAFAFELQEHPQAFGLKIIQLQSQFATLPSKDTKSTSSEIKNLHKELRMRLAVIRWLESPER